MNIFLYIVLSLALLVVALVWWFKLYEIPFTKWIAKRISGTNLPLWQVIQLHLKNVPFGLILDEFTRLYQAGVTNVKADRMGKLHVSGGDVHKVVSELIRLKKSKIDDKKPQEKHITFEALESLHLSKGDITLVATETIKAFKSDIEGVDFDVLAKHHLSGGNVKEVVDALIILKKAQISVTANTEDNNEENYIQNIKLSFDLAAAIDLSGRDVHDDVVASINPKLLDSVEMEAITRDGFRMKLEVGIIVQAQVEHIIGRPGEKALIAKLEQALMGCIAQLDRETVVRQPDKVEIGLRDTDIFEEISHTTSFKLVSIDVQKATPVENITAQFEIKKKEADLRKRQLDIEQKRLEDDFRRDEAKTQEQVLRNRLLQAQTSVQQAMAEAFRSGNFSIMDYEKLQNLQADTRMRQSLATDSTDENETE